MQYGLKRLGYSETKQSQPIHLANGMQWCNCFCLFGSVTRRSEHEAKQKQLQPVHSVPIKLDIPPLIM